jgi:glutathione S-transferase
MILYVGSRRYSSWSLRPYLVLAQSGLPFETRTILLDQPDTKANIVNVSPSGKVPVLHDDALVIPDSLAICEYVAELAPGLWPADRAARARARAISAEMHAGFSALRRDMSMKIGDHKPGEGHTPDALADVCRVLAIWHEQLAASGGPFLFGAFTIADAMYAPVTARFATYGVELDATARAYVDAIAALPAMQRWIADAATEPRTRP